MNKRQPPLLPLKVINVYAGPGAGKSTLAAGLFNIMKVQGHKVELVTEFAKDLTYERNTVLLGNQLLILAEGDRRLRRLVGSVEWVITDSPLPLGLAYTTPEYEEWLGPATWGAFRRYQNYHVLLVRDAAHPYQAYGRNQTEAAAIKLDRTIADIYREAELWDCGHGRSMVLASNHQAPFEVYEQFIDTGETDGAT